MLVAMFATPDVTASCIKFHNWSDVNLVAYESHVPFNYIIASKYYRLLEIVSGRQVDMEGETVPMRVDGLRNYVEYRVRVRGFTHVGPGPWTNDTTVITAENCKFIPMLILTFLPTMFYAYEYMESSSII